jgi:ATP-dependent exoDNAse (exonuclease V) beta subunit
MANIRWSYSSLKEFINCPKQYQQVKVLKNYTKVVTQQMTYGTEVHKALEDYTKGEIELPKNYQRYKSMVDAVIQIPGTHYAEHRMALNADKRPCSFDADDYWVRGIVDLLVVDEDTAFIVDYKTGSNKYPDPKQLKLMALMTFEHFPEVEHIKAGLLFVAHNAFVPEEYKREQENDLWKYFEGDLERLRISFESDNWPANPTPLCGWCPVRNCEFQKSR